MLALVNTALTFDAFFTTNGQGTTGLPDVDVYVIDAAGTLVVNGASATELDGGLYTFTLAQSFNNLAGSYRAVFVANDPSVDQQELAALILVGTLDVVVAQVAQSLVGNLTSVTVNTNQHVESADKITMRVGDDYPLAFGRQYDWTFTNTPALIGGVAELAIDGIVIATGAVIDGGTLNGDTLQIARIEVDNTQSALLANSVGPCKLFTVRITQSSELMTEIAGTCVVLAGHAT